MQTIRFHQYGAADVLHLEEVDVPTPGPGQALVAVASTSFNGVDANIRAGAMQGPMPVTLPHVPGLDLAGTVTALGPGTQGSRLAVGDRVVGFLPFTDDGAAADHARASVEDLAPAPTTVPLDDAAALPLVGLTALQALEAAGVRAGQRVLVNGAGGAVGLYAVQLARASGAVVIAVAAPRHRDRLLERGAAEVLDPGTEDLGAALSAPVDALLNLAPVTPERLAALVAAVADGGVVVSTTVWMATPGDEARGVRAVDFYVRSDRRQLAELVARVDRGELVVDVAERVALADLPSVHARAAAGDLAGKVVVRPGW
ncbi:NADP-dependent oxidoreductase [Nocardioides litoris]|uniref:NADP-dependent oxidoreductase n=1 Tax=Nocardioides litoris TaxID=1926648 RepID=UPI00111D600D|nr:NADP-dependent oxidoreductase [Nocardioides litoris]